MQKKLPTPKGETDRAHFWVEKYPNAWIRDRREESQFAHAGGCESYGLGLLN